MAWSEAGTGSDAEAFRPGGGLMAELAQGRLCHHPILFPGPFFATGVFLAPPRSEALCFLQRVALPNTAGVTLCDGTACWLI